MPSPPLGRDPELGADPAPVLRLATYNILLGGGERLAEIERVLRSIDADVVALQEADQLEALERLGRALGYELLFGPAPTPRHQAMLTRLPVLSFTNHRDSEVFLRNSLELWVRAGTEDRPCSVGIHAVHLTAAFQRRGRAEPERLRELAEVRRQVARHEGLPQAILGDFNSVAPGDRVRASDFFARISEWRRSGALRQAGALGPVPPALTRTGWWGEAVPGKGGSALPEAARSGLPHLPWLVHPLLELLPRGEATDALLGAMIPRAAIQAMLDADFVDCLRRLHPRADAFTCPSYQPAVRIDYVLANRQLAPALSRCEVVGRAGELASLARRASDHFPVLAEFRLDQLASAPPRPAHPGRPGGA